MKKPVIAYEYGSGLYLNITNRCPTSCVFCIKRKWDMDYRGNDLNLRGIEPASNEVINAIAEKFSSTKHKEIVFCGYGEPTMRFDVVKEVAQAVKLGKIPGVLKDTRVRINTNGLGNLVNGRDITKEMKGIVDSLNVSLNCADPEGWKKVMRPDPKFLEKGFESVKDFVKRAKENVPEVLITAAEGLPCDKEALEKAAIELGVKLRMRPAL